MYYIHYTVLESRTQDLLHCAAGEQEVIQVSILTSTSSMKDEVEPER